VNAFALKRALKNPDNYVSKRLNNFAYGLRAILTYKQVSFAFE
jgi:hypothetical protein